MSTLIQVGRTTRSRLWAQSRADGVATNGEAAWELINGTKPCRILEMSFQSLAAATSSRWGIGKPAAAGITPTTPLAVLSQDQARADGTITTAVAWATKPTIPANFLEIVQLAAAISKQIITFEDLWLPPNGTLVAWNLTANQASAISVRLECEV